MKALAPSACLEVDEIAICQLAAPMEVFYELSKRQALLRPVTPGYPVMAKIFEKSLADIANGAAVEATLDAAVDEIDADIEKNGGYGL